MFRRPCCLARLLVPFDPRLSAGLCPSPYRAHRLPAIRTLTVSAVNHRGSAHDEYAGTNRTRERGIVPRPILGPGETIGIKCAPLHRATLSPAARYSAHIASRLDHAAFLQVGDEVGKPGSKRISDPLRGRDRRAAPAALDLAQVLGIHLSDAASHLFQGLAMSRPRRSDRGAERLGGPVSLGAPRQLESRTGRTRFPQSWNSQPPWKLDMFPHLWPVHHEHSASTSHRNRQGPPLAWWSGHSPPLVSSTSRPASTTSS